MKGAHLWKRILNEGIEGSKFLSKFIPDADSLAKKIVTARIIVCGATYSSGEEMSIAEVGRNSAITFPFKEFWIEFPEDDDWTAGAFVCFASFNDRLLSGIEVSSNALIMPVIGLRCRRPFSMATIAITMDSLGLVNSFNKPTFTIDGHPEYGEIEETNSLICAGQVACGLQMLSCKNIGLQPHDNDPKQVRRAIKRHGGTPESYRYHTLVVRPAGSKPGTPGQDIGIMPRHVCRGHFSEYGPEFNKGLLFGKYSGRFYVPPHMKGKKENGTVEKDYMIPAQ